MKLSGGKMIVQFLDDHGVEFVFGYPGGSVLHTYDALFQKKNIKHILVRHEQAATHAADGYARATGKPGVVLVTSGPGATNAITGIATAYADSIPMVVLSGQAPTKHIGSDFFQEVDMIGISRPIVKHSFLVRSAEEIPYTLAKAFYIASTGRPGPVVVDFPKDVTDPKVLKEYTYHKKVAIRSYNPSDKGHSGQVKKALQALVKARQPVIYTGGGVISSNGAGELFKLAKALNAPVTNTLMGLGGYPASDPQYIGMLGMHGTYEANMAMHHSDMILAVGARFDDRVTNAIEKFCPNAKIAHIDIDPASISKNVQAHIPVVGPADKVLAEMNKILPELIHTQDKEKIENWWVQINSWREFHGLRYNKTPDKFLKPQEVVESLYNVTGGDAYVTTDVGQHQMFAAQFYHFDKPRRWISSGGLGTMGFGLPAAMGAQLAFPDKTVVCVTGEGSIQMNIQELSTCMQYDIPVKIININNQALGMVRQWQDLYYDSRYSHSYVESLPDFVKLAESYGHVGIRVDNPADLDSAMEKAFSYKDKLVFMDIIVDKDEHVYPMQIPAGAMCDMFISKGEETK